MTRLRTGILAKPPLWGWSGAILFNSAVRCELRRDMRRGIAEGVLAVPAAKTD